MREAQGGVAARAPASVRCQRDRTPPFPGLSSHEFTPIGRRRPGISGALLFTNHPAPRVVSTATADRLTPCVISATCGQIAP
jgi:hypothetical protein